MRCPFCLRLETKVVDSRLANDNSQVRRRRECLSCKERFTTYEVIELALPRLIKSDGERALFSEDKLRTGILKALEKRPVDIAHIERAISQIIHKIRVCGEREIASRQVGEYVMDELRALDAVAYIRFASVYLSFQDVSEFIAEIDKLKTPK